MEDFILSSKKAVKAQIPPIIVPTKGKTTSISERTESSQTWEKGVGIAQNMLKLMQNALRSFFKQVQLLYKK